MDASLVGNEILSGRGESGTQRRAPSAGKPDGGGESRDDDRRGNVREREKERNGGRRDQQEERREEQGDDEERREKEQGKPVRHLAKIESSQRMTHRLTTILAPCR
jgi:hypothetical protein